MTNLVQLIITPLSALFDINIYTIVLGSGILLAFVTYLITSFFRGI